MDIPDLIGLQKADDTVCIPDRGNLRSRHNKCLISPGDGVLEALFDTGRTIQKHIVKFFS